MKTSESIKNLAKALLKAQKNTGAAVKGSKNPFFKSSYADLPTVMEVVKEPLNDAGILVLQPPSHRDGKNFIVTTLIHEETGEFISAETEVICSKQNDAQSFGAAQTYARRFGLQAMLFIPSEDDDGNQAAGRTAATNKTTAPKVSVPASLPTPVATEAVKALASAGVDTQAVTTKVNPSTSTQTEVKPLKTSNFSKNKKAPAAVVAAVSVDTQTQDEGWNQ